MTGSLKRRVATSIAWMTSARAAARLIGLISTLVLARLLTPADFGIVAMAMSIAAALELLTSFSLDSALVQERHIQRSHYDTAWTLNLLMAVALAVALALSAGLTASFYREPRLEHLMYFIGLKYIIDNALNPGTVDFRRNLAFEREFVMQVGPKLTSIFITVPLAFWLRDYRALIAGMLFASSRHLPAELLDAPSPTAPVLRAGAARCSGFPGGFCSTTSSASCASAAPTSSSAARWGRRRWACSRSGPRSRHCRRPR